MKKQLRIKFLPYEKFRQNNINSVLKDLHENTIIIIDAKLNSDEEFFLIRETMKKVSDTFSGIELSSLEFKSKEKMNVLRKTLDTVKTGLLEKMIGKKRGMTIIGPADLVRKVKKNPEDVLLYV